MSKLWGRVASLRCELEKKPSPTHAARIYLGGNRPAAEPSITQNSCAKSYARCVLLVVRGKTARDDTLLDVLGARCGRRSTEVEGDQSKSLAASAHSASKLAPRFSTR